MVIFVTCNFVTEMKFRTTTKLIAIKATPNLCWVHLLGAPYKHKQHVANDVCLKQNVTKKYFINICNVTSKMSPKVCHQQNVTKSMSPAKCHQKYVTSKMSRKKYASNKMSQNVATFSSFKCQTKRSRKTCPHCT